MKREERRFDAALHACLEAIRGGASSEEALEPFADLRDELRPLLWAADEVRTLPTMPEGLRHQMRKELEALARELDGGPSAGAPPTGSSGLDSGGAGPWTLILATGLALGTAAAGYGFLQYGPGGPIGGLLPQVSETATTTPMRPAPAENGTGDDALQRGTASPSDIGGVAPAEATAAADARADREDADRNGDELIQTSPDDAAAPDRAPIGSPSPAAQAARSPAGTSGVPARDASASPTPWRAADSGTDRRAATPLRAPTDAPPERPPATTGLPTTAPGRRGATPSTDPATPTPEWIVESGFTGLSGTARDEQGNPLADAVVLAYRMDGVGPWLIDSDADGAWRLDLPPGDYQLRVRWESPSGGSARNPIAVRDGWYRGASQRRNAQVLSVAEGSALARIVLEASP